MEAFAKNIFGDINNHSSSNAINFSSVKSDKKKMTDLETSSGKIPDYSSLKKDKTVTPKVDDPKALSSNNLVKATLKPKPKPKPMADPLSYSNYSTSLKKISDPLSQMKPVSSFGYPTKNKTSSNTKNETTTVKESTPLKEMDSTTPKEETIENTQKEEDTQKEEEKPQNTPITPITNGETPITSDNNTVNNSNNASTNIKITNTTLMNNIFGNYNPNLLNLQNTNNNLNNTNNQMYMNNMMYLMMMNNNNNMTGMQNMTNMTPMTNSTNMTNMTPMTNATNMTNMTPMTNATNMTNMTNMTAIPNSGMMTNMASIPNSANMTSMTNMNNLTNMGNMANMTNMTNLNNSNMKTLNNQNMNLYNNNQAKSNFNAQYRMATSAKNYPKRNEPRNELNQIMKIGDLYSDTNLIREKCRLMNCEKIKDLTKASFKIPDKKYMGILVLTNFRLIFQIENESNLSYNYPDDYFKIPLFRINKIEKVQDKKMSYDAYPMEITLKDTRVIKFHVWDQQRFYYNLSDATNPRSPKIWFIFAEEYNQANFLGKNITNGWNIYDPIMEFSRQGVTEENDLKLRYCYINKDFSVCPTYPKFLIEPQEMTDEELRQTSIYRSKGRLPIFSYYYNGNVEKNSKKIPTIWRSAQNKRGIIGSKKSDSDIKLLNLISKLGNKLYIYDCRPKLNAFVNRVNGGGYENIEHYDNATLHFCEIDNIHKARKALASLYSICLSDKINDYNNFWTNLEQSGWFQFIYLMLKNANEISKLIQGDNSVLIHCSDGWDRTAQLSSLSQLLLDPFFRTINGFAVLVEKDWLSFGHQFGLRNGFAEKEKQDQASPIFLQFLDAVHQLLEQFPTAFEFNEKFLLFLAKTYNLNLYGTFMYNNEKERTECNAKFNTASVWTEIFRDLKPYLNVYYDANSFRILEPNYSYYNLKLWTSYFMENNIYLENKHFYISDMDKNMAFRSKQEFFAYQKKQDESKFMDYQIKYEELLKVAAETYSIIKDNTPILDKLSDESKKVIEELKPKFEKINKNKAMKQELLDKLKGKKENENKTEEKEEKKDNIEGDDKKVEEKEGEDKKEENESKEKLKEENDKKENEGDTNQEEPKKEEEKEEIREDNKDDNREEEVKKEETNDESIQNNEDKKDETENENRESEVKEETVDKEQ